MRNRRDSILVRSLKDHFFVIMLVACSLLVGSVVVFIFFDIIAKGIMAVNIEFLTGIPKPVGETGGGVLNAIVGSIVMVVLSCIMAVPISVFAGIYLAENPEKILAKLLNLAIDILQGFPSIVLGIIVYIWLVKPMSRFSMLSGSIALAIIMIPVIVRSAEEAIKLIPEYIREASFALGTSYYRMILKVILPISISGILTGILISIARVAGETAPLLFTAFGNPFFNVNPLKPVDALPLIIFNYAKSPFMEWYRLAWGASFVLIVLVIITNVLARWLTKRWRVKF